MPREAAEAAMGAGQVGLVVPAGVLAHLAGTRRPHTTPNRARVTQILLKKGLGPRAFGQVSASGASLARCGILGMTQIRRVALVSVRRCPGSRNMIGRGLVQLPRRLGTERRIDTRRTQEPPTRAITLVPHRGRCGVVSL